MADSDSLIDGGGTVKKNIHWFIIGIISIVIVAAIFMQDASSKKRKAEAKATQEEKVPQSDVANVSIAGVLDKQKDVPVPNAADLATKLDVPAVAIDGVGRSQKETEALNAQQMQAIEDAKIQQQLNGSSIMSISPTESSLISKVAGLNPLASDSFVDTNVPVSSEDMHSIEKAKAEAAIPTEAKAPQGPQTKSEQDLAWQDKQSAKKSADVVIEDAANSPYTIFQGTVIPAVSMTKVNSQLPGQVTGIVSQDVFDGVSGSRLMIPKGSTLYGTYNNSIVQGQSRLMLAFSRLIFPNGRSISLLGMPSSDKVGQAGIDGDVNNHYFQRYGLSFLTAIIGAFADNNNTNSSTTINTGGVSGASSAAGSVLLTIANSEAQRAQQIQPNIELKQGEKFNITVNRDIAITPYQ